MQTELITFPLLPVQTLILPAGSEVLELIVESDVSRLKVAVASETDRKDGAKLLLADQHTGTLKSVPAKAKDTYELRVLMEAEQGRIVKRKKPDGEWETRDLHEEFMRELTRCEADPQTRFLGRFETRETPAAWRVYLTKKETK